MITVQTENKEKFNSFINNMTNIYSPLWLVWNTDVNSAIKIENYFNSSYDFNKQQKKLQGKLNKALYNYCLNKDSDGLTRMELNTIVSFVFPFTFKMLTTLMHKKLIVSQDFQEAIYHLYGSLDPGAYLAPIDFL